MGDPGGQVRCDYAVRASGPRRVNGRPGLRQFHSARSRSPAPAARPVQRVRRLSSVSSAPSAECRPSGVGCRRA
jgi:hypothetical protein